MQEAVFFRVFLPVAVLAVMLAPLASLFTLRAIFAEDENHRHRAQQANGKWHPPLESELRTEKQLGDAVSDNVKDIRIHEIETEQTGSNGNVEQEQHQNEVEQDTSESQYESNKETLQSDQALVEEEYVENIQVVDDLVLDLDPQGDSMTLLTASKNPDALQILTKALAGQIPEFVVIYGNMQDGAVGVIFQALEGGYQSTTRVVAAAREVAVVYLEEVQPGDARGTGTATAVLLPELTPTPFMRGTLVRHRELGFCAIVVELDPVCRATEEWIEARNALRANSSIDQIFYAVLVGEHDIDRLADENILLEDEGFAYVAHEEVERQDNCVVHHIRRREFFETFDDERARFIPVKV